MNSIDKMNRAAFHDRGLSQEMINDSIAIGREAMADAAAALARNPANSPARRAAKAKAQRACAPIVAAMLAEKVRPEFKHLVAPEK
jgi:hypothetical protein